LFCPNCGKEIQEDSEFCIHCGIKIIPKWRVPLEEDVRNIVIRRIEAIKNRDAKAIERLVHKERYTKFDDWPPFELQGPEGLDNEAKALRVLKKYDYETRSWKVIFLDDSALAAFIIRYRGEIRDLKFDIQSRVTIFLTKHHGEWKIVHEHWSRFPTASAP